MDTDGLDRLLVTQDADAAALQRLDAAIARQNRLPGRGVRVRSYPWGRITNYDGQGGAGDSVIFAPSVARAGDDFQITWQKGLINGVEPTIDGQPISKPLEDTGKPPFFTVTSGDFGDAGECLVYFRTTLDDGWFVKTIEPIAAGQTPPGQPRTFDKLALILYPDGTFWRALKMNVGFISINRKSNGEAQHIPWAKP